MTINKLTSKLFILSALILASCTSDDDGNQEPRGDYENGILISGEGSAVSGSVSFVSNDFLTSENLIYKSVNNAELGTFLQSMAFDESRAFIVVDNANTITVVDRYTFEEEAVITEGLEVPRYMTVVGNKGYVTNWGKGSFGADIEDDYIAVINLDTYTVEAKIDVAIGPEKIIENNGKLYVSHIGAFSTNNVISVITIADGNVEEITVGYKPDEIFLNDQDELIVLCGGNEAWTGNETEASIIKININDNTVVSTLSFSEGEHPDLMDIDNDIIYYALNGAIYEIDENGITLPTTATLVAEGFLYGMEVGNNNIYTLDTSFSDVSTLHVYDLDTNEKTQTVSVALGASKIYFN